jgi:hypothetical protein
MKNWSSPERWMSSGPPLPSSAKRWNGSAKGRVLPSELTSIQVATFGRRGRICATASRNSEA